VHAADGTKVWTTAVPHLVDSSPSVTADRVFVGDNNGIVSALDRATGSVVWSKPAETVGSPHLWSSPIVLPDVNLVVAGLASAEESNAPGKAFMFRGSVSALDAATGAPRWQFYTSNNDTTSGPGVGVWSTACVDTTLKLLYIGTGNAYQAPAGPYTDSLLAIHYDTGKLEWSHQFTMNDVFEVYTGGGGVDSDVGSSPNLFSAGGKDLVGVGVKNGTYYALDRKTGTVAWQRHVSGGSVLGGIMGASAYANGVVFVAGNEGIGGKTTAMALNATDGSVLWTFSAPQTTYAALAQAGGVVYLGTTGGVIYGIDAATGKQLWTDKLPDATAGGVSIGENLVFAPWGFYFTLLNGTDPGKGGLIAYGP
jgi:polyvinyl alcohol dehydrogenase (cytochrome)